MSNEYMCPMCGTAYASAESQLACACDDDDIDSRDRVLASAVDVAAALENLLRDMETPRTRKATEAWDYARKSLAYWKAVS